MNLRSQSPLCRPHYEVIDPPKGGEVIDPPKGWAFGPKPPPPSFHQELRSRRRPTHLRDATHPCGSPTTPDPFLWVHQLGAPVGSTAQLVGIANLGQLHSWRAQPTRPSYGSKFELNCPFGSWMPKCLLPSSPRPLFAPPTLAKPTALCTVASNRLGQTSACHALLSVQFPRYSPNSKDHFAIPNLGPLHSCPYAGGGHSIEPTAQVGLISEHRPEASGAWGLPTIPSPLTRAERSEGAGWVGAREACGQPSDPRTPDLAVGTRSKKEGPGTACPGRWLV